MTSTDDIRFSRVFFEHCHHKYEWTVDGHLMSRRLTTPRTSSHVPYPRKTPGQPKSSRQQFSACGACRMRRVRCDLKDTSHNTQQQPSCSNCRERGIKCVDEFAEVKAVKLLRRGRRLQQVEAVYGKVSGDEPVEPVIIPHSPLLSTAQGHSLIPQLQLSFLNSSFFRRFCVQRPVIEPSEFASRYTAHIEGTAPINVQGKMLAMLLVIWAASFGIDEFGNDDPQNTSHNSRSVRDTDRRATLLRTEPMVREVLTLVDIHGLLRRPSWDGVRVLLLLLPLTHGIQNPIERLTTYEATLSQVDLLCNPDNPLSINSGLGPYCDALIRARIFWYAHIHEAITTGLEGGRLRLDNDLDSFQSTLPPPYCAPATYSIASPPDSSRSSPISSSPVTPTFPFNSSLEAGHPRDALTYQVTSQYFSLALAVSRVCRAIHSTLTGPRSRHKTEPCIAIKDAVFEIWDDLERCWNNFETLRRNPSGVGAARGDLFRGEDAERVVSGWQVFIFQCLNVVREALLIPAENNHPSSADQGTMTSLNLSAIRRCQKYLPRVIKLLQRHLKVPSTFFAYDAGLIRDGCFFAGLLLAQSDTLAVESDAAGWDADWEEGVKACLEALGEIRWAYSRTQEREQTLRAERDARIERDANRRGYSPIPFPLKESPGHSPCLHDNLSLPYSMTSDSKSHTLSLVSAGGQVRPYLRPLSVSFPQDDSGPDTVLTDDGSGSWELYTPPPTAGSMTGTIVTHRSLSPVSSPPHSTIMHGAVKSKGVIFGDDEDVDQFSFTVDGTPDSRTSVGSGVRARWTPFSGNYLDPHFLPTSDLLGCGRSYFT